MQHLLAGAVWDEHAVRNDVRDYLVEHLGDPGAVLVSTTPRSPSTWPTPPMADTAWSTGSCTCPRGGWPTPSAARWPGCPRSAPFAAKPELARVMLGTHAGRQVPAGWVTADEVYGGSPTLRGWLETHQLPFVLADKCTEPPHPTGGLAAHQRRPGCQGPPLVCVERGGAGRR
jgi:DDE superfamily endonuclease